MAKTATTLLLGLAVGALTTVLYRRYQEAKLADQPEQLIDKITRQISDLEHRVGHSVRGALPTHG